MSVDLQAVRDRIASGWTQCAFARNAKNYVVNTYHESATCWCLSGAAYKEKIDPERLALALGFITAVRMVRWQDAIGRTQAEVLARLDAAIAKASADPAIADATGEA